MNKEESILELLEKGIHLGHKKGKYSSRMGEELVGIRSGMNILNLEKTVEVLGSVTEVVSEIVERRGKVLFVGTGPQIKNIVGITAKRCKQPYVNSRWVGGTLTNWKEIFKNLERMSRYEKEGTSRKDRSPSELRKYRRLKNSLSGLREMESLPDILFILETNKHRMAIKEAMKLNIPIIGIVDSDSNPIGLTYAIPGNDDNVEAIYLYCDIISKSIMKGIKEETLWIKDGNE